MRTGEARNLEVDVLRGLAVLGMVIWDFRSRSMGNFHVAGVADSLVDGVIAATDIQNTVHLVFAFLFGWGLALGMGNGATTARRLVTLFVMGMATACLLDRTDILRDLAVIAVPLLLCRGVSNRAVLTLAVAIVGAPVVGAALLSRVLPPGAYGGTGLWDSLNPSFIQTAGYGHLVVTRAHEALLDLVHPRMYVENLDMLVVFLLGLFVSRRGLFGNIPGDLGLIWRTLWIALAVHLLGVGWTVVHPTIGARLGGVPFLVVGEYSKQALTVFYMCSVVILLQMPMWRRVLGRVAGVGRLALSAYLLQGFIGPTLFFGYGVGLYGRLGVASGEALAVVVCIGLVTLSNWWLSRFALGPAEWAWRVVTYWRLPPLRRPSGALTGSA